MVREACYQALTETIIVSGWLPPQQALPVSLSVAATSRIDEHRRGVNVTLQPLVVAAPVQMRFEVVIEPT